MWRFASFGNLNPNCAKFISLTDVVEGLWKEKGDTRKAIERVKFDRQKNSANELSN